MSMLTFHVFCNYGIKVYGKRMPWKICNNVYLPRGIPIKMKSKIPT